MSEQPVVVIKYSSYTEAQKKATKKYRETHKDLVNTQRRKYYMSRVTSDPTFIEYKRQKAREYYKRKKENKQMSLNDVKTDDKITSEPTPIVNVEGLKDVSVVLPVKKEKKVKKVKVLEPIEEKDVKVEPTQIVNVENAPEVKTVKVKKEKKVKEQSV